MIQTSDAYKAMMKRPMRNRGYISVALGVINQNAQGDVYFFGNSEHYGGTYYSKGDVFKELSGENTYGSLEQNFTKANGKFLFPPRESATAQYLETGYISNNFAQYFEWIFNGEHDIKGLTIEFEPTSYPTAFTITTYGTDGDTYHFDNDSYIFETDTTFGEVERFALQIDPDYTVADNATKMSGGAQRLHIRKILCGIGVNFQGDTVESAELESFISGISAEASYKELALSALDEKDLFDVDQTTSLINYLEPLQPMSVSLGVDLDNGKKEWVKVADLKLKDWSSRQGKVSFTATDVLTQDESNYSHMVLESRTAKSEFEAILASMGLSPDEYKVDDNLASVYITNPIEENTHRDCLQLLANATRSIVYEDENGVVKVDLTHDAYMPPNDTVITRENVECVLGDCVSTYTADEDGVFVDKSDNIYNPADTNNHTTLASLNPQDPNTTARVYIENNIIKYEAFAYEETIFTSARFEFEVGQVDGGKPFGKEGHYLISLLTKFTSENDYCRYRLVTASLAFGDEVSTSYFLSDEALGIEVTPSQLETGETPILTIEAYGLTVRGYHGEFTIQISDDITTTYRGAYKYDLKTPTIIQSWETALSFSQFAIGFDSIPKKIRLTAYNDDVQTFTQEYVPANNHFSGLDNLGNVNKVKLEVLEADPNTKVAVQEFVLGNIQPYSINLHDVFDAYKAKEPKIKEIKVKIYTYEIEDGEIRRVDDEVYYTEILGTEGITKTCENPLISSAEQAETIALWLANYYTKQKTYEVEWRGEPALQSHDYVKLENKFTDSLVVNVEKNQLSFNGAFHGGISARQAN